MAQVTERPLLLIAGHGERGGARDNKRLSAIAARTGALLPGWEVRHGVLAGAPSIEEAATGASARAVMVWPFFMCRGYFIRAVSRRLEALGLTCDLLQELGAAPELVAVTSRTLAAADARAAQPVLVVAHGSSKGPKSRLAAQRFARALANGTPFKDVLCAFLEEPPFAAGAIADLPAGSAVISLFAGDGLHGGHDMAALIAESGRDDLTVVCPAADIDAVARIAAGVVDDQASAKGLFVNAGGIQAREVLPPMPLQGTSRRRSSDSEPLSIRR